MPLFPTPIADAFGRLLPRATIALAATAALAQHGACAGHVSVTNLLPIEVTCTMQGVHLAFAGQPQLSTIAPLPFRLPPGFTATMVVPPPLWTAAPARLGDYSLPGGSPDFSNLQLVCRTCIDELTGDALFNYSAELYAGSQQVGTLVLDETHIDPHCSEGHAAAYPLFGITPTNHSAFLLQLVPAHAQVTEASLRMGDAIAVDVGVRALDAAQLPRGPLVMLGRFALGRHASPLDVSSDAPSSDDAAFDELTLDLPGG